MVLLKANGLKLKAQWVYISFNISLQACSNGGCPEWCRQTNGLGSFEDAVTFIESSHDHHVATIQGYLLYLRYLLYGLFSEALSSELTTHPARPQGKTILQGLILKSPYFARPRGKTYLARPYLARPRGKNLSTKSSNSPTRSSQEASQAWARNNQICHNVS